MILGLAVERVTKRRGEGGRAIVGSWVTLAGEENEGLISPGISFIYCLFPHFFLHEGRGRR